MWALVSPSLVTHFAIGCGIDSSRPQVWPLMCCSGTSMSTETSPNAAESFILNGLKCGICAKLCTDAMESPCCGHLFCAHCIETLRDCPLCRAKCQFRPSYSLRRLIKTMDAYCQYCDAKFIVATVRDHERYCSKRTQPCGFCLGSMQYTSAALLPHLVAEHPERLVDQNDCMIARAETPSSARAPRVSCWGDPCECEL